MKAYVLEGINNLVYIKMLENHKLKKIGFW